jgi:hypothetical protein
VVAPVRQTSASAPSPSRIGSPIELVRLRREIDALQLVIPFLIEATDTCQVEYSSRGEAGGMPCRKPAVAQCADCARSALTAVWRAAGTHFAISAITTMRRIHA